MTPNRWRTGRNLRRLAATAGLLCAWVVSPSAASGDVRTVVVSDGPDPGVTFDIASIAVRTDRDAGTFTAKVDLHAPLPSPIPGGGLQYLMLRASDAPADACLAATGAVGDVVVTIEKPLFGGGGAELQATTNVRFRNEYAKLPVTIGPDRRSLSMTITDDLLKQSNHRCVAAAGSGQAVYDPSKPGGGASYDLVAPAWFDGQQPPPPPPPPAAPPAARPPDPPPAVDDPASVDGEEDSCDPAVVTLKGAARVAHRSTGSIAVHGRYVSDRDLVPGATVLTMTDAVTGRQFYRHAFTPGQDRRLREADEVEEAPPVEFFIDLDPERRPAVVTITWKQESLGGPARQCSAQKHVGSFRGTQPAFYARGGGIGELIPRARHCWETRGEPVLVTVRAGREQARFTRGDACTRFQGRARTVGGLRVRANAYGALEFASSGAGFARVQVRVGKRVTLERDVLSRIRSRPDRRIWEGTDAFFNYCLKGLKELYSYRLRLYCVKPGFYDEAVVFRR